MPSASSQCPAEAEAVLNAVAASGRDYDASCVGVPMPELITLQESKELFHAQPIYFQCEGNAHCRFYFDIDRPCVVKINTWPLDEDSGASLFVGIDREPD